MNESLEDRLRRFSPDGSGLDRDVLLFAAGRASARAGRGWAVVAGALALTQVFMVTALWPRSTTAPSTLVALPELPVPSQPPTPLLPLRQFSRDSSQLWALRMRMDDSVDDRASFPVVEPIKPDEPPLRILDAMVRIRDE